MADEEYRVRRSLGAVRGERFALMFWACLHCVEQNCRISIELGKFEQYEQHDADRVR